MPSSAAKADAAGAAPERIAATARFMVERGIFGLAWLDRDLSPFHRYGPLVDTVPLGLPITSAVDVFLGFEDEIRSLSREPGPARSLAIPNVLLAGAASQAERVNLAVYWLDEQGCYLLLVTRAVSWADIEYRLAAEVRARSIAEAEVAAQSRIVQKINNELAAANRDLQEFASVISHDLRAPLRGLRYAASDAGAAIDAGDAEAAGAHIARTLGQARRMSAMLTGLLDYARAGRKADAAETVDTGRLASEIVGSIGAGASHEVAIEGDWPILLTVAEPLDIVLRNLLDNAIKHHDRDAGRIVVRGEDDGHRLLITVTDDGPGIAPAWHEAIFLPFRQVADTADASDVDGAGIGLALVKKTVERFGGSIEVVSDPAVARGATFRVVWPKQLAM